MDLFPGQFCRPSYRFKLGLLGYLARFLGPLLVFAPPPNHRTAVLRTTFLNFSLSEDMATDVVNITTIRECDIYYVNSRMHISNQLNSQSLPKAWVVSYNLRLFCDRGMMVHAYR